jgi:hypothetical protein
LRRSLIVMQTILSVLIPGGWSSAVYSIVAFDVNV